MSIIFIIINLSRQYVLKYYYSNLLNNFISKKPYSNYKSFLKYKKEREKYYNLIYKFNNNTKLKEIKRKIY